ncbi:hypothetical protein RHMOL_Rhmol02G0194100 [Rhododendron molle]|uniref:Uncharacterized protein n=1 Tax=Rhododendron molle TaxID=49168 RepID=A0ACC0PSB6_RHOML|nr:hypothetical protein RHMOL_Rhmol02G0194100 [Rhododendron molle]
MSNRTDPAWKYSKRHDDNKFKFTCNFCNKVVTGSVYRVKLHLVGGYPDVTSCPNCPEPVKEEIRAFICKKKETASSITPIPDFDEMGNEEDMDEDEFYVQSKPPLKRPAATASSGSKFQLKKPKTKGPMDAYFTPDPEIEVENRRSGKQPKVDDNTPQKKLLKERAHQAIARWIYDAGIPLNVVNVESFEPMIEAIGQYGPGLTPPTYYQVRVPLLKKEVENVNKQMEDHKQEREENGCTLMCDGWTDRKNRSLINFLVNCPKGSMFIESVDASSRTTNGDSMYRLLDEYVERIGEANVVQVVTDSAAYNKMAVLRLVDGEEKPAMGYIYEAMDRAKETIINTFSGGDENKYKTVFEIIDTRWEVQLHQPLHAAGYYLNPAYFYKDGARRKADKEVWRGLVDCIERLVPTARMQDEILHQIALYEEEEGIFKKDMAIRQRTTRSPASHQKRNKLDQKRLNDLVFVKYNRALRRRANRCKFDPISLKNIDESNEWLIGKLEDELVFDGEDLDWNVVAEASGVEQPSKVTRSTHKSTSSKKHSKASTFCADDWDEEEFDDTVSDEGEEEDVDGYRSNDDDDEDEDIGDE